MATLATATAVWLNRAGTPSIDEASVEAEARAFIEEPSVETGLASARSMASSGDTRWVWWLLDLHRINHSTRVDAAAIEALAELTGLDSVGVRHLDFANYGTWARTSERAASAGEGYRTWKTALYSRLDPGYRELLADVDDATLANLHWGGARRGGIPELNDPERLAAADADWLTDDDIVLGVVVGEEAVAYPFRVLGRHELINDTVGSAPLAVVYCTLCRSGLVFDRRVGDRTVTFQTSGLLLDSNKVMVDNETDSLWHHLEATAIAGPLSGVELDQLPLVVTRWGEWLDEHPDTETLALPDPIFFDDPERPPLSYDYTAEPYADYYAEDEVWFPIATGGDGEDGRTGDVGVGIEDKTEVIGLVDDETGESVAIVVDALEAGSAVRVSVGRRLFIVAATDGGARIYEQPSEALNTGAPTVEAIQLTSADEQAASTSDGQDLGRVAAPQLFWFAWRDLHPATGLWSG